jgi:hypothetical protein
MFKKKNKNIEIIKGIEFDNDPAKIDYITSMLGVSHKDVSRYSRQLVKVFNDLVHGNSEQESFRKSDIVKGFLRITDFEPKTSTDYFVLGWISCTIMHNAQEQHDKEHGSHEPESVEEKVFKELSKLQKKMEKELGVKVELHKTEVPTIKTRKKRLVN